MKFIRKNIDYLTALAITGLAAYSFATGDTVGGWVCLGIAVGLLVVLKLLYAATDRVSSYDEGGREAEIDLAIRAELMRRAGVEPMPIPGEDSHDPGNCRYCVEREL